VDRERVRGASPGRISVILAGLAKHEHLAELTLQKNSKAAAMGTICHAEPLQGSCAFDKENPSDGKPSTEVHVAWQLALAGSFSRFSITKAIRLPLGRETPELYRSGLVFRINPDVARTSADAAGRAFVFARTLRWR
jgi:hypothetical protein